MAELRGLGAINDELSNLGVKIVAVSVDPPKQSHRVVERHNLPFPILADEQLTLTRSLGLLHASAGPDGSDIALPAHVLIDKEGRIRWKYVADRIQNRLPVDRVLESVRVATQL